MLGKEKKPNMSPLLQHVVIQELSDFIAWASMPCLLCHVVVQIKTREEAWEGPSRMIYTAHSACYTNMFNSNIKLQIFVDGGFLLCLTEWNPTHLGVWLRVPQTMIHSSLTCQPVCSRRGETDLTSDEITSFIKFLTSKGIWRRFKSNWQQWGSEDTHLFPVVS